MPAGALAAVALRVHAVAGVNPFCATSAAAAPNTFVAAGAAPPNVFVAGLPKPKDNGTGLMPAGALAAVALRVHAVVGVASGSLTAAAAVEAALAIGPMLSLRRLASVLLRAGARRARSGIEMSRSRCASLSESRRVATSLRSLARASSGAMSVQRLPASSVAVSKAGLSFLSISSVERLQRQAIST